jgi:hypothetical protein
MNDESRIPFLIIACLCLLSAGVRASTGIDPTNEHAWAENTGWINADPTNGGATVRFDGTSGYLTGFAWGENIGWIKLGADAGGPYANTGATDWGVNLSGSGHLSGYAWGENVGWLTFDSSHHQSAIDLSTGHFAGEAWGENIGWVRLTGIAPDYGVRTLAFDLQPLGTPNWWLDLHDVTEDHEEGDGEPAWREYVADTDPQNAGSYFHITTISSIPPVKVFFPSSSRRFYSLLGSADLRSGAWTTISGPAGIQGTGGPDWLQDTSPAAQRAYCVEVGLSP